MNSTRASNPMNFLHLDWRILQLDCYLLSFGVQTIYVRNVAFCHSQTMTSLPTDCSLWALYVPIMHYFFFYKFVILDCSIIQIVRGISGLLGEQWPISALAWIRQTHLNVYSLV